jgi:hypothetical protein
MQWRKMEELMPNKPSSKAQARFYGAVAGGAVKIKGFSRKGARNDLRGMKVSKMPARAKKR